MEIQAEIDDEQIKVNKYAEEWLEISEKLEVLETLLKKSDEEVDSQE